MANTSSAKKANRAAARKRVYNERRKRAMKNAVKGTKAMLAAKKSKDAAATIPELYKAIDKAAKSGTIHRNTAARMKSRLTKRLASSR